MKAVFTYRPDSIYDDVPGERYNFPKNYLDRVRQTVGDWIVMHELKGAGNGSASYVSLARVRSVEPDPLRKDRFYAHLIDPVDLARFVPINGIAGPIERMLRHPDGTFKQGPIVNAVRLLGDDEFDTVLALGGVPAGDAAGAVMPAPGFAEPPQPFERAMVFQRRAVRDAMFRTRVLDAYDSRCALTGMRLINGGGAAEVDAAHIKAVGDGGPDIVQNGIAMSRSVHWMFDRYLITFEDDLSLIRTPMLPEEAGRFLGNVHQLAPPRRPQDQPNRVFVSHHREKTLAKARSYLHERRA